MPPHRLTSRRRAVALAVGLLTGIAVLCFYATALHTGGRSAGHRLAGAQAANPPAPSAARPPADPTLRPRPSSARLTVAVLGDSVPAASACNCVGFADLYSRQIAAQIQMPVDVVNLGTPGQTSSGLLASLASGAPAARVVAGADIITITIGANDFQYGDYSAGACAYLTCYSGQLERMRAGVDAVLDRIEFLRAGQPTAVRVTGYWNVWKDGAVGRAEGKQYSDVSDTLTREVNAALSASASGHNAAFVDLFSTFRGVDGTDDDTALLASDGDHPDSEGHQRISQALVATGLSPLL